MQRPRRSVWNTYAAYGYGDNPGQDGVCLHQVRRLKSGWQERILEESGARQTPGPAQAITDLDGETWYATAVQKWEASVEAAVRLQKAVERPLQDGEVEA